MINRKEVVEKVIKDLFIKLDFKSQVEVREEAEGGYWANIKVDKPSMLIGRSGQNLADVQHLVRLLVNKKLKDFVYLTIDINDYKQNQKKEAEDIAQKKIKLVLSTQESQILEPMSPYMRKLIHMEIKKEEKLTSRSIGQEPSRRVMIELI